MDDEKETDNNATDSGRFPATDWAELTHECLTNILSRLSLEDRWRGAMRVCKAWHQSCKDPCLSTVLDLESHYGPSPELPRFWIPDFERRIDNMLGSVAVWSAGYLTEIRVRHCSDRSMSLVAKRCPNLQVLSIKSSPRVTDAVMAEIAAGCPKIKELDVSYCSEISDKSLAIIGSHCPDIRMLNRNLMIQLDPSQHNEIVPKEYLHVCPQDGDSEAAAISKFMPRLRHLELRFSKLTGEGLNLISKGCRELEYLDLGGCANVTSRDIGKALSNLKKLNTIKKPNVDIPWSVYTMLGERLEKEECKEKRDTENEVN